MVFTKTGILKKIPILLSQINWSLLGIRKLSMVFTGSLAISALYDLWAKWEVISYIPDVLFKGIVTLILIGLLVLSLRGKSSILEVSKILGLVNVGLFLQSLIRKGSDAAGNILKTDLFTVKDTYSIATKEGWMEKLRSELYQEMPGATWAQLKEKVNVSTTGSYYDCLLKTREELINLITAARSEITNNSVKAESSTISSWIWSHPYILIGGIIGLSVIGAVMYYYTDPVNIWVKIVSLAKARREVMQEIIAIKADQVLAFNYIDELQKMSGRKVTVMELKVFKDGILALLGRTEAALQALGAAHQENAISRHHLAETITVLNKVVVALRESGVDVR